MSSANEKERIMKTFFENLERETVKKGWKRSTLKKASGVNLERYRVSDDMREPSLSSAVRIADALGVSLDDLCGRIAFVRDRENWSAGECLDVLTMLLAQLGGDFSAEGLSISLPPSNVTEVLRQYKEFVSHYESARKLDPSTFCKEPYAAADEWLARKIEEMKRANEEIGIFLRNGETNRTYNGTILTSNHDSELPDEEDEDDEILPF